MLVADVILLDRDGVINQDSPDYIKSWDEFRFLPGSLEALRMLSGGDRKVILITNQSIINREMVPLETLNRIHSNLRRDVENAGGRIDDIFYCPHHPDEDCNCRKPKPGLIEQAVKRYGFDPGASVMIGDSAKDILCGRNAGCGTTMLVQTGNGPEAQQTLNDMQSPPDFIVPDLLHAARLILAKLPGTTFNRPT